MTDEQDARGRTPGPWNVETDMESYGAAIRRNWNGGRKTVAYVEGPGLSRKENDQRRRRVGVLNARLIAAAPDLLEAAKAALEELDEQDAVGALPCEDQLRDAIRKAEEGDDE